MANVKPSIKSLEGQVFLALNVIAGVLAALEALGQTDVFSNNPQMAAALAACLTVVDTAFIFGRSWVKKAAVLIDQLDNNEVPVKGEIEIKG